MLLDVTLTIFSFSELAVSISFFTAILWNWFFFIRNNFFVVRLKPEPTTKNNKSNVIRKLNYKLYIVWFIFLSFVLILYLNSFLGWQLNFWWDHFRISNFFSTLLKLVSFVFLFLVGVFLYIFKKNTNFNIDYFFILGNIIFVLLFMFLVNNMFTFYFVLETNSLFVFYKLVVSKIWYKSEKSVLNINFNKINKLLPQNYINNLFFQYWSSFFSSILIIYSLLMFIFIYGSADWVLIEYLSFVGLNFKYFNSFFFFVLVWFSFLIGFFLKIGFTPFQLFKVEIYKNLPLISIFFYTTFYFLVFFFFLSLLFLNYLNILLNQTWFIFLLFILFGGIYIVFLFFDTTFVKAFFSYSTVINIYLLFCILFFLIY